MNELLERNEGSIQKTFAFPDEKVSVTSHIQKILSFFFFVLMQYYVQKKQQKSFDGTWTDLKKSCIMLLMEKTFVNWGRVTGHFFFTKPRLNITKLLDWLDDILSSFLALKDNGNFLPVQKHFWLKSLWNIFLSWKSIEKGKFNRKL